jgi:hypothetical protein
MPLSWCNPRGDVTWGSVTPNGTVGGNGDTYTERVTTAVEDRVVSDFVRGESRGDIQLTVLDEQILVS